MTEGGGGILSSLRKYEGYHTVARRGTVDIIQPTKDAASFQLARCHLVALSPLLARSETKDELEIQTGPHRDAASIALAVHHLNTGNASIVAALQDLPQRCPVRFTLEAVNTAFNEGTGLQGVINVTHSSNSNNLESSPTVQPCAFVGAYLSAVSMPTAIVSGLLGYPQVSPFSTSTQLDDKTQFPLFGRTIPPDAGNAVPLVLLLRRQWQVQYVAVLHENSSYGNAFAEGIRRAAQVYAPDMVVRAVTLDDYTAASIASAVMALRETGYRFVFGLVFSQQGQDEIMLEAYRQGVAGDGRHQWLFGDNFWPLEGRTFPPNSPLHLAYRGVGVFATTGGVQGDPTFDKFVQQTSELANPVDVSWLQSRVWSHEELSTTEGVQLLSTNHNNDNSGFAKIAPFAYEATVALGLAACRAVNKDDLSLNGIDHFAAFSQLSFDGIGGRVEFDPETGSRLPEYAMYRLENYVENDDNSNTAAFRSVTASLFQNSEWSILHDYVFNDGTTRIPEDEPLLPNTDFNSTPLLWSFWILAGLSTSLIYCLIRRQRHQEDNSVWKVDPRELAFADPPRILGRGTFGLVLAGEYRGTQVAVKRVIPPRGHMADGSARSSTFQRSNSFHISRKLDSIIEEESMAGDCWEEAHRSSHGLLSPFESRPNNKGTSSFSGSRAMASGSGSRQKAKTYVMLKAEFREEMRHLAKLRHPCVTTIMGAVLDEREDPLLVMELMDYGSLFDLIHNETLAIDGDIILPILRDISQGMRFLHSSNPVITHGDLKAANILVDNRFRAKVSDFGLSQKRRLGGTGTPYWMAPELLRKESANTSKTDVYSFGVTLFELYSRKIPYEGENVQDVLEGVADSTIRKRVPIPSNMPSMIQSVMKECQDDDPEGRPSFEGIDQRLRHVESETVILPERLTVKPRTSLFDMFPKDVAEALRDGRKVEASHRDVVTIFFSDVVGFTDISATLSPAKVANMLDRLYNQFDSLTMKHDVYKVDTIGDAFIAASNLIKDQPDDHCKRIAEFSIDAVKAANATLVDEDSPSKGCVNIRVGFHSGSVVADVVGHRNPRYTLFGDAMNTASRMESNSQKNRVNCSIAAAEILQQQMPDMPLRCRGEIHIKGKGPMCCYWVNESGTNDAALRSSVSTKQAIELVRGLAEAGETGESKHRRRRGGMMFGLASLRRSLRSSNAADSQRKLRRAVSARKIQPKHGFEEEQLRVSDSREFGIVDGRVTVQRRRNSSGLRQKPGRALSGSFNDFLTSRLATQILAEELDESEEKPPHRGCAVELDDSDAKEADPDDDSVEIRFTAVEEGTPPTDLAVSEVYS